VARTVDVPRLRRGRTGRLPGITLRRPRLRPWRHWTLRFRMVAAIVTLAAVGLVVANVAGVVLLRGYLISRVDEQLSPFLEGHASPPREGTARPPNRGFGPDFSRIRYSPDGLREDNWPDTVIPDLGDFPSLVRHAGQRPHTVTGRDGPLPVAIRRWRPMPKASSCTTF